MTAWSVVLAGPDGDDPDARIGITIFTLFGAVLPIVTLVFSLSGAGRRWLAGDQPPAWTRLPPRESVPLHERSWRGTDFRAPP